jgi:hypothetical protein
MLERFLKLRTHINSIIGSEISAPSMLSAREMRELEIVLNLLQPFESATREVSASKYTTGSIIIPLVYNLKTCLEKVLVDEGSVLGKALKLTLSTEIHKRLATAEQMEMFAVATILDPRFKKNYFSDPLYCAKAIEYRDIFLTLNIVHTYSVRSSLKNTDQCIVSCYVTNYTEHQRF